MLGADERFPVGIPRHVCSALRAGERLDNQSLVARHRLFHHDLDPFLRVQGIHYEHAVLRAGERGTIGFHAFFPVRFHLNLVLFHHGLSAAHSESPDGLTGRQSASMKSVFYNLFGSTHLFQPTSRPGMTSPGGYGTYMFGDVQYCLLASLTTRWPTTSSGHGISIVPMKSSTAPLPITASPPAPATAPASSFAPITTDKSASSPFVLAKTTVKPPGGQAPNSQDPTGQCTLPITGKIHWRTNTLLRPLLFFLFFLISPLLFFRCNVVF